MTEKENKPGGWKKWRGLALAMLGVEAVYFGLSVANAMWWRSELVDASEWIALGAIPVGVYGAWRWFKDKNGND